MSTREKSSPVPKSQFLRPLMVQITTGAGLRQRQTAHSKEVSEEQFKGKGTSRRWWRGQSSHAKQRQDVSTKNTVQGKVVPDPIRFIWR